MTKKKGKAPVRAPCPERLRCVFVGVIGVTIFAAKLEDFAVSLIGDLCQKQEVVDVEVGRGLRLPRSSRVSMTR